MAKYPYTSNGGRFKTFTIKLRDANVPPKVTYQTLEALGFKSNNDRPFIGILRFLGLLDQNNVPTEFWQQYRDKSRSARVLANAVKSAYSNLFSLFPDAHRKDNEALRNFFRTQTNVGKGALDYMVQTFRVLVEMSDFDSVPSPDQTVSTDIQGENSFVKKIKSHSTKGYTINLNIELTIPETKDPKTYDLFFQAMKKHLLSDD